MKEEEPKHPRTSCYENEVLYDLFRKHRFHHGRMISGSKSGYSGRYPKHDTIFNANIFTPSGIWWNGDLDLTKDNLVLQRLCNELEEEFIVTYEAIGWQGATDKSYEELCEHAHARFEPKRRKYFRRVYDGLHGVKSGNMTIITSKGVDWVKIPVRKYKEPATK